MIKFKKFDVNDVNYEEQFEQFKKEYPNAELVKTNKRYLNYETCEITWFKYETRDTFDENDVEKLKERLKTTVEALKEICECECGDTSFYVAHDTLVEIGEYEV